MAAPPKLPVLCDEWGVLTDIFSPSIKRKNLEITEQTFFFNFFFFLVRGCGKNPKNFNATKELWQTFITFYLHTKAIVHSGVNAVMR